MHLRFILKTICSPWINEFTTFSNIQSISLQKDFYAMHGWEWVLCYPGLNIDGLILQASQGPVCGGNLSSHSLREERNWRCSYGQKGSEGVRRGQKVIKYGEHLSPPVPLWRACCFSDKHYSGCQDPQGWQIKFFSTSKNWRSLYKTDVTDVVAKSSRITK